MAGKPNSDDLTAAALRQTLISPNECDSNSEDANVVDGLFAIARALRDVAAAVREASGPKPGPPA